MDMDHRYERPSIRALLKTYTQPYHDQLDTTLDLLHRPLTHEEYRKLLACFYGFYAPTETALAQVLTASACPLDFARRRKTPLLERDLQTLGMAVTDVLALPRCSFLPVHIDLAQALGCLYVLEGATLGGPVISRHLHTQFGFTAEFGCAFFLSYGKEVGSMWQAFCNVLTECATMDTHQKAMVAAACETFAAFERWVKKSSQHDEATPNNEC